MIVYHIRDVWTLNKDNENLSHKLQMNMLIFDEFYAKLHAYQYWS